jgi:deoxyribodipyrimidine photolyase
LKQNLSVYKETRNGGRSVLFKISAWLAMGCISPRTIYKEIRAYEKENGAMILHWLILNYYGVISFALCSKKPDYFSYMRV